jgi:hypothetical protein
MEVKMTRIYLVGAISEDPASFKWRKEATRLLGDKFEVIDPTTSKFDKEVFKGAKGDAEKWHALVEKYQAKILLPKSFQSVSKSNIVLANLALEASDRSMVGSIMEIAWAFHEHKTIVAIKGSNYYCRHPMIQGCVHAWAEDVIEATDIIKQFFN